MKMKERVNRIILIVCSFLIIQTVKGQYSFQSSWSVSGSNCENIQYQNAWIGLAYSWGNGEHTGYGSHEECEALRTNGMFPGGYYSVSYNGCSVLVTSTPCVGPGGNSSSISNNNNNFSSPSQGSSFFSSNPAYEVMDWAEDNEELLKILGGETPRRSEIVMENGYVFSAHMPGTIRGFVLDDNPEIYGASDGVHVPDGFFDRPFSLDTRRDYYSDDFRNIKTELQPVHFAEEAKKSFDLDDVFFDDLGDVVKFAVSLPLYAEAATLFLADMTINLAIEDAKMGLKLYKGEYVNMDEVTSTIAYNTLNKSIEDALFILTSKSFMKAYPLPQLPESVYSGSLSFLTTFVSINSRHINAGG